MKLEGVIPYDPKAAELYNRRRWWLGMTFGDVFNKICDLYPDREALVGSGRRFSYIQLRRLVDTLAYRLLEEGLKPKDTILLQLPNWPEFVISYFAFQKAGLIPVLLTVNHTTREVKHLAGLTGPKGWILPARYRKTDYRALLEGVKQANPSLDKIITVGAKKLNGCLQIEDLLHTQTGPEEIQRALEEARPGPEDICQILPSGGTTGLPKGAPRTHNDYICNVEYKSRAWDLNVTDTCLAVTTVGHNLALLVCITGALFQGAKIVMLDSTYPEDFCKQVQEEKVTSTGLVPTMISRIVKFERLDKFDLSSLTKIYVGAANSPPELVKSVEKKLGCRYINAFGMVEGPCAQTRPGDPLETRCRTIGHPICPYDDFQTLDPSGKPTPPGVEGEMAAKGPGIFTGYLKNPQANQDAFTPEGYFRTGDLAVIELNGTIRITGRIKDIIIRGGENIAAQEVEELITTHPLVEYVAVIGMPDPDLGEQVCAYIKPVKEKSLTHQDILDHLARLEAAKIHHPARTEFVDEIPLTAAGKADKKALKKDLEHKLKVISE